MEKRTDKKEVIGKGLGQGGWAARSAVVALLFAGGLSGCGAEGSAEEGGVDVVQAAIGEASCATTAADVTFNGGVSPAWTSPQTYSNSGCFKALIVDINNYSSSYLGAGDRPGGTYVEWADGGPSTQAACQAAWVRADRYQRVGSQWVSPITHESHGDWISFFGSYYCVPPAVSFVQGDLQAGQSYRFSVTARDAATSSAATRRLKVESRAPEIIR